MRKALFNLHLYLALVVGIFVVIIGVTGSIMAFEEEIDHLTNSQLFKVEPKGERMGPAALIAASSKATGQKINSVSMPQAPDDAVTILLKGQQYFLNPYSGELIGSRNPKTWLSQVHQIHTRLLLGNEGKMVVVSVTAIGIFLVLSGIYLWWSVKRWTVKWSASWRRIFFDLHNAAGIYSSVFLLILSVSGIIIHYDDEIEKTMHARAGTTKVTKQVPSAVQAGATQISADQALANALAFMPGTKPLSIAMPPNAKGSYLVALRFPEDLTPGGRSWANVDQYSGVVNNFQNSRTVATGTRAIIVNRATHTGDILGVFSKLTFSISSLLLVIQALTGYFLWWKKLRIAKKAPDSESIETAA